MLRPEISRPRRAGSVSNSRSSPPLEEAGIEPAKVSPNGTAGSSTQNAVEAGAVSPRRVPMLLLLSLPRVPFALFITPD